MITKSGNANSGSWHDKMPRFAFVPKGDAIDWTKNSHEAIQWHTKNWKMQEENDDYPLVESYASTNEYYAVNSILRGEPYFEAGPNKKSYHQIIDGMMKIFTPLDRDVVAYRGANGIYMPDEGGIFESKSFTSTTINPEEKDRFIPLIKEKQPSWYRMVIPKGTPVIFANEYNERELILPPNMKFKVAKKNAPTERKYGDSYANVDLEIIKNE